MQRSPKAPRLAPVQRCVECDRPFRSTKVDARAANHPFGAGIERGGRNVYQRAAHAFVTFPRRHRSPLNSAYSILRAVQAWEGSRDGASHDE
jgi:hypothetical protein